MLKLSLSGCRDAYIFGKGTITVVRQGEGAAARAADKTNKQTNNI